MPVPLAGRVGTRARFQRPKQAYTAKNMRQDSRVLSSGSCRRPGMLYRRHRNRRARVESSVWPEVMDKSMDRRRAGRPCELIEVEVNADRARYYGPRTNGPGGIPGNPHSEFRKKKKRTPRSSDHVHASTAGAKFDFRGLLEHVRSDCTAVGVSVVNALSGGEREGRVCAGLAGGGQLYRQRLIPPPSARQTEAGGPGKTKLAKRGSRTRAARAFVSKPRRGDSSGKGAVRSAAAFSRLGTLPRYPTCSGRVVGRIRWETCRPV